VGPNLPRRELLAGTLVDYLFLTFKRFEEFGLQGFMGEWRANDWLLGREITVDMPDKQITGTAAGVAEDGALLVDTNNGQARVISGSIVMAGPKEQGA
jgi:BirA family biotin operon repressor/biotin-[acetyl-CoA-carboxylase] ligase